VRDLPIRLAKNKEQELGERRQGLWNESCYVLTVIDGESATGVTGGKSKSRRIIWVKGPSQIVQFVVAMRWYVRDCMVESCVVNVQMSWSLLVNIYSCAFRRLS
jgi:hypothetical protein